MKTSIWDILTALVVLAILCLIGGFVMILVNPAVAFNPMKPPAPVATIALPVPPSATPGLPPTWTPTPEQAKAQPGEAATLRPSSTPLPTATLVVLPTFTPSKTVKPGVVSGNAVSGGACQVIYQNPKDDTVVSPASHFQMRWTIKNTSDKQWASDSVDVRFMSGERMHLGNDVRDMPYSVSTDAAVDILVDMIAPTAKGTYTANWALTAGNTSVCRFFVTLKIDPQP